MIIKWILTLLYSGGNNMSIIEIFDSMAMKDNGIEGCFLMNARTGKIIASSSATGHEGYNGNSIITLQAWLQQLRDSPTILEQMNMGFTKTATFVLEKGILRLHFNKTFKEPIIFGFLYHLSESAIMKGHAPDGKLGMMEMTIDNNMELLLDSLERDAGFVRR